MVDVFNILFLLLLGRQPIQQAVHQGGVERVAFGNDGQVVNGAGEEALGAAHHVLHGAHRVAMLAVNGLELAAQGLDLHILGLAVLAVLAALVQKSGVLVQLLPGFDHPVDGVLDVGILHGLLVLVLGGKLLLHLVEGLDVLELPRYGLLAREAHCQQGETVAVHEVLGEALAAILKCGLMEEFSGRIFGC